MEALFIYLAKVNIALAVFYLLYVALLKNDTFIRLRRYYFVGIIAFSLIYPLTNISSLNGMRLFPEKEKEVPTHVTVTTGEPAMVVLAEPEKAPIITGRQALMFVALTVSGAFLLRFLWQLSAILRLHRKSKKVRIGGVEVLQLEEEITPFSFFGWIFIHTAKHKEEELLQIILHERTHARQWHSLDILLAEMLYITFWWNPVVWLMKRDMAINLEYLADKAVLRNGVDMKEYQYHLLRLTYHETAVQIVNNFNVSQLKQRIMMMNKSKSPTLKMVKYAWIIPFAIVFVMANSMYAQKKVTQQPAPQKKEVRKSPQRKSNPKVGEKEKGSDVFVVVEKQPEFPGGQDQLMKFLSQNIKYPVKAQEKKMQGRTVVSYVVEKDGSISDVQIVRSSSKLLDEEAIRVVKQMPRWKPGMQDGEKVRVRYTLPVHFRLTGDDKKDSSIPPPPPPPAAYTKSAEELKNTDEIFMVVENQPEFPGGNAAMMKYLSDNVKYPKEAQDKGLQGRVICNFVVAKDGSITDVRITKGVHESLNKEAIRVIQSMPKWIPGTQQGVKVRVRYTLPITFSLGAKASSSPQSNSSISQNKSFEGYLASWIKYPTVAQQNGITGLSEVSYFVDNSGKVSDVKITKSAGAALDNELVALIRKIPANVLLQKSNLVRNGVNKTSAYFHLANEDGNSIPKPKADLVVAAYGNPK